MTLQQADFDYVRSLVRQNAAIVLENGKEYLVEARLTPLLAEAKASDIAALVAQLRSPAGSALRQKVIEALTTNETFFFRDTYPFEALRKDVLPACIAKAAGGPINIWCAASSTGQEPYSIAMLVAEHFPAHRAQIKIMASDLASHVLAKAKEGVYNQLEVNRGLPAPLLVKYFTKQGMNWCLKDDIKKMVEYRMMNLAVPFPPMGPMDIVFIRNVLIYFDQPTKKQILENVRKALRPGGYLFLGGSETTFGIDEQYTRIELNKTACYQTPLK